MDLLANYDDESTPDNSTNASPRPAPSSNHASSMLENEWLSFEQMITPGGVTGGLDSVKSSSYLVDGVVAYPGMMKPSSAGMNNMAPVVQSSESSSSEDEADNKDTLPQLTEQTKSAADDDDAFFLMRKQIKERDQSSSSSSDSSSASSSRSASPEKGSPSPPHLSPVNSVKSHESEPPNLIHAESGESVVKKQQENETVVAEKERKPEPSKPVENTTSSDHKSSKSRERKRSHRDRSRSKHRDHGSSRSKKHRSRSRSKDRKHRHGSRDRHRHKEKKRHSSRDRRRSKSRDRKRSKSRERKSSRSENGDKRRSRSRDRKDRKKDQKQSSSRNRHRSRSKERRRDKSKDIRRKDRRSRSRSKKRRTSRSRSRERLRSRSPVLGRKLTFKEQMRKEILTAGKEISNEKVEVEMPAKRPGETLKPSDLLKGIKISSGESVTPQMALMQTMAAMHKKAQEITGVEVPKYYNPAAVNPLKYAEQVQKRKLLWAKKDDNKQKEKDEQIETQWKSAFIAEEDGKTASKFRKLMGMKAGEGEVPSGGEELNKLSEEQRRKHAELFQRLDQEYAFARMTTHTQRGVGLGFSSQVYDPNHPSNPPP